MIELRNVEVFRKAVEAISCFISEGNFRFTENGLTFKAIDPSQIVLINFSMPKSVFDKYEVEPCFVGLDLSELNRILSRAQQNDSLQMDLTDSELLLKLEGELTRNFRLPLIDVKDDEINIADSKFDASVKINSRILKEALKDAALFGSSVVVKVKGNEFLIEARGNQGTLKTVAKETDNIIIKASSEVVSKYSLSFLSNIVKEADSSEKIELELKNDAPMKVTYNIGQSSIKYHLAHMIL
ncbi:MAG: proliferating cell nuclear antigen (pcna) [archaeon]